MALRRQKIKLDLSSYRTTINAVKDNNNLVDGEVGVYGDVLFKASGTTDRKINLSATSNPEWWFNLSFDRVPLRWDIGINPAIPTDLIVDGGSGSVEADLSGFMLTSFRMDVHSGSASLQLPTSQTGYIANIDSGSGAVAVNIVGQQNLTLELDGGSGSINIHLPANSAYRIEVLDDGSGSLRVPAGAAKMNGSGDKESGTWQTSDYESAAAKILIRILNAGSGSITIH